MTPDALNELTAALRERLAIIGDAASRRDPERHMARLRGVSEKIESLQASISPTADPRLKHFLERRSYDKALEWLEAVE
jgi:hypothetical protein